VDDEARAANLELWNRWTRIHEKSAFYDVDGFLAGKSSLWPLELEELGPYVQAGTTLLHLQCHFGLDTLSWARMGADVVGLDFSDEAITLARRLAGEAGLSGHAEFICSDLYDADLHLGERLFDVVFVSWGAIEWLPDLERWAAIIARHLRPGGAFYLAEMHPFAQILDDEAPEGVLRVLYPYFSAPDQPVVEAIHS
jgi:2-polyprenyl-3-methyl-5-hydroxy-6-metoxy-1,4-benzoquinol methylase